MDYEHTGEQCKDCNKYKDCESIPKDSYACWHYEELSKRNESNRTII